MGLVPIIFAILVFLVWFIFSVYATSFWFQQPYFELKNKNKIDWTKRFAWWYGFSFFVFMIVLVAGGGITILAMVLKSGLGL